MSERPLRGFPDRLYNPRSMSVAHPIGPRQHEALATPDHRERQSRCARRSDDTDARKATVRRFGRSDRRAQRQGYGHVHRARRWGRGAEGIQLDEDMARRNAKALGDLHEGPSFTGTRVEDVDVPTLGMRLGP